jgi:NADPH:quinone reductase-like Zn-dependent oxidoreductase
MEYAIALTEELALRPKNLSWEETATVALSAETAWQELFVQAGYQPVEGVGMKGVRVLVTAASGGVGIWTVQLARWAGAEVVGTCGPDNIDFVKSLGASEALNYRSIDVKAWVEADERRKFDLVVDGAGGKSLESGWWAVKDGGKLVSVRQPPEQVKPEGLGDKNVKAWFFIMESDGSQLKEITKLIDEGKCRTVVDSTWPLESFEKAYERADSGHAKGKVVIQVL